MLLQTLSDKETAKWLDTLTKTTNLFNLVSDHVDELILEREMAFTNHYKMSKWRTFWYGLEDMMYKDVYIEFDGTHQVFTGFWFRDLKHVPKYSTEQNRARRGIAMAKNNGMKDDLAFLNRSWHRYASIPFTPTEGDLEKYMKLETWHFELTYHAKALGIYNETFNLDEDRK